MPGTFNLVTHVILAPTPLAANNYIARYRHSFSNPERLWFFYYGSLVSRAQISALLPMLHRKKIILLYEDDLLGRIAAIKIACWLKRRDVQVSYQAPETIHILFNGKSYTFPEHTLSLNRFEKTAGFRSQIKTCKTVLEV
jgi:hypothetical protein